MTFSTPPQNPATPPNPPKTGKQWLKLSLKFKWRLHWILLFIVVLLLMAFTAVPALDTFRPVRIVQIRAVLAANTSSLHQANHLPDQTPEAPSTRVIQAPGWLEPDPYYIAITALTDGVVSSIYALEGESVTAGQLVAQLIPDDAQLALRQAQAMLATAQAQHAIAQAQHTAARTNWDQPIERTRQVAVASAALAESRARQAQLPAMIQQVQAQWERWQKEYNRVQRAFDNGVATQREVIVAKQETAARLAALDVMTQRKEILAAQVQRLEAEHAATVEAAKLRVAERQALDAATAQVALARATVANHEAQVDQAKLRLKRMNIHAPIDGYVMRRFKSPGDKVMLGINSDYSSHILHLYDPASLQVRVDVPLADASQIYIGQQCQAIIDVLPDQTFHGQVHRITHQADLQKNTLQIKVRLNDPSPLLRPEMLTRVRFLPSHPTATTPNTSHENPTDILTPATHRVRVPQTCLDNQQVWVVRHRRGLRGQAHSVPVQILTTQNGYATVIAALNPGDLLIDNPQRLQPGDLVQFQAQSEIATVTTGNDV